MWLKKNRRSSTHLGPLGCLESFFSLPQHLITLQSTKKITFKLNFRHLNSNITKSINLPQFDGLESEKIQIHTHLLH